MKKDELTTAEETAILRFRKEREAQQNAEAEMKKKLSWVPKAVKYYMDNYNGKYAILSQGIDSNERNIYRLCITKMALDPIELTNSLEAGQSCAPFRPDRSTTYRFKYFINNFADWKDARFSRLPENVVAIIRFSDLWNPYIPKEYFEEYLPEFVADKRTPVIFAELLPEKDFSELTAKIDSMLKHKKEIWNMLFNGCPPTVKNSHIVIETNNKGN